MISDVAWDDLQSCYEPGTSLTQEERRAQRKEGQFLHKMLNESGLRVQLKGCNNDYNQTVIGLPNRLWLLVEVCDGGFSYHITDVRDGRYQDGDRRFESRDELLANIKDFVGEWK